MYSVDKLVKKVLEESERARSSDKILLVGVLQERGMRLSQVQLAIFMSVNMESVTRARRKYQEKGMYPPTKEVARQRRLKSMIIQQNMPTAKPGKIINLIEDQPKAIPWRD